MGRISKRKASSSEIGKRTGNGCIITDSSTDGKCGKYLLIYVEFEVKSKRKKTTIREKAEEGITAVKESSSDGMSCDLNLIYADCGKKKKRAKGKKSDKGKGRARDVSSSSSEGMAVVFLIIRDFA
jgi:hypothetical protein